MNRPKAAPEAMEGRKKRNESSEEDNNEPNEYESESGDREELGEEEKGSGNNAEKGEKEDNKAEEAGEKKKDDDEWDSSVLICKLKSSFIRGFIDKNLLFFYFFISIQIHFSFFGKWSISQRRELNSLVSGWY